MADTAPEALTPAAALSPAEALTQMIKILEPLKPEDRRRTVTAVMTFLGEPPEPISVSGAPAERKTVTSSADAIEGSYSAAASRWLEQNGISPQQLDHVFHFNGDGSFDIHDAPGKSMREKTLNAYILTGIGKFLTSNDRTFDDSVVRNFCTKLGCYDPPNHGRYLKEKGPEFSGDKSKGYTLTNIGLKRGAALVKELARAAE